MRTFPVVINLPADNVVPASVLLEIDAFVAQLAQKIGCTVSSRGLRERAYDLAPRYVQPKPLKVVTLMRVHPKNTHNTSPSAA